MLTMMRTPSRIHHHEVLHEVTADVNHSSLQRKDKEKPQTPAKAAAEEANANNNGTYFRKKKTGKVKKRL